MRSSSLVPMTASTSGMFFRMSSRYRSTRQPATISLRARPGLLVLRHLQDGVDGFLLGGIDEAARIDDDDVGVGRVRRQLVARGGQLAHHDFGIDEVLGTAETDKSNFQNVIP